MLIIDKIINNVETLPPFGIECKNDSEADYLIRTLRSLHYVKKLDCDKFDFGYCIMTIFDIETWGANRKDQIFNKIDEIHSIF